MAAATWHCKQESERERERKRGRRERKVMRMLQTNFNFRRVAYNLQAVFRLISACVCVWCVGRAKTICSTATAATKMFNNNNNNKMNNK